MKDRAQGDRLDVRLVDGDNAWYTATVTKVTMEHITLRYAKTADWETWIEVLDLPDIVPARVRAAGARPSVLDKMIEDSASGAAPAVEGGAAGTGDSKHDEVDADEPADKHDAKCEVEAKAEAEAGGKAENKAEAAASPAPEDAPGGGSTHAAPTAKESEEIGTELEEIEQMEQRLQLERLGDKGDVMTARLATRAGSEDEDVDSAGSSEGDGAAGKPKGGDVVDAAASAGIWECLACTLINCAGLDACGVCGTRLGLGAKRARVPVPALKAGASSNTVRADEAGVCPTDENMKPGEKSGEEPPARKRTRSGTSTKVKCTGLTQNLQSCPSSLTENPYESLRVDPDSGSTL